MVQGRWAEGSGFGGVLSIVDTKAYWALYSGLGLGINLSSLWEPLLL
jgi:hypothetical protein